MAPNIHFIHPLPPLSPYSPSPPTPLPPLPLPPYHSLSPHLHVNRWTFWGFKAQKGERWSNWRSKPLVFIFSMHHQ